MGKSKIISVIITFEHPFNEKESIKEARKVSRCIGFPVEFLTGTHGLRVFPSGETHKWIRIDVKEG